MKASDIDFSDASEGNMGAKTLDGWNFVTDQFSDHCETPLKEFHEQFDIQPDVLLSGTKSAVD